jgi:CRISPR-associated protein Cas2
VKHSPSAWLVAYDIANPKRLGRVHRLLQGYAVAVQYSVFAGTFSPAQLRTMQSDLAFEIDPAQDDVRLYPLPARCEPVVVGKCSLPDGVQLGPTGLGIFRLLNESGPAALAELHESRKPISRKTDVKR